MSDMKKIASIMKGEGVPEDDCWNTDASLLWSCGDGPHSWVVLPAPPCPRFICINGATFPWPLERQGRLARLWFRLRIWWAMRRAAKSGAVFIETRS